MKFKPQYLLIPVLLIIGYFLVKISLPRYTGMYWLSTLLILGDIYLWSAFRKKVFGYNIYVRVLIIGLYWLSLFSVFFIFVGSAIVPIINWNDVFRTYLYGFVFSIYTAKLLPILFYLVADAASFINKTFHLSNKQKRQIILEEQDGITRSRFLQYLGFLSGGMVLSSMFVGMFKWEYEYRVIR